MNGYLSKLRTAVVALAIAAIAWLPLPAKAQTVVAQPNFAAPRTVVDLGNGPTEILPLAGNGFLFTQFGTAVGTAAASVNVTLTTTPSPVPCVGCFVTCPSPVSCTIPASTTVASFTPPFALVLSAAATITAASINFGNLCPVSTQAAPVQPSAFGMAPIQAGSDQRGTPMYTQGRVCAYGGIGPGLQFANFPIGAH